MAISRLSILVVIATIFLPTIALAEEFVVGDDHGWTTGFDYKAWAADKTIQVGDKLVFNYPVGKDNVFNVNGTAFQSCTVSPPSEAWSTGSDVVVLATPGRKWYISGVHNHCNVGQKLFIIVQQPDSLPTSLPPSVQTPGFSPLLTPGSSPRVPLPPSPSPSPSPVQHVPHFGRWVPKMLLKGFY